MRQACGLWVPDGEEHLVDQMEARPLFKKAGSYQLRKLLRAMYHVKEFGVAADVGAHVGTWSRVLMQLFDMVIAFEPQEDAFACLSRNMAHCDPREFYAYRVALGDDYVFDTSLVRTNGSTMFTRVAVNGSGDEKVLMSRLDRFNFDRLDFLKIDVEGFEEMVVRGGQETICKHHPVIVVEQKPGGPSQFGLKERGAVKLLCDWGARLAWKMNGDYCLTWGK